MYGKLMVFEENQVEVFEVNGVVYFNPYHVGECLGLTESAVRMAVKNMNDKQVIKLKNSDVKDIDIRKLNNAGENFLTESGVYKLIFRSNKPNAEKFTDWVTDEVLPSVRQEGAYITNNANPEMLRQRADEIDRLQIAYDSTKLFNELINEVGLSADIKLLTAKTIYNKAGINLPINIQSDEKYFDTSQIAKRLGVLSKSSKPANTAVSQIIKKLDIADNDKKDFFEGKGKWQGTVTKYTSSVIEKAKAWLKENDYPAIIKGANRNYHVQYNMEVVV